jgi:hypothetical protein
MARQKKTLVRAIQLELLFDELAADPSPPIPAVKHEAPGTEEAPRRTATAKTPPKEVKALPKLLPRRV